MAVEAARYICRRLPNVPKTSFVKYLYLTDREYAARHGHTMLGTKWWREDQGPLSSAITKMIRGPEFQVEESKTATANPRLGHVEVADTPFGYLGSAEMIVIDIVVSEFGSLDQVELLERVHALPEVRAAKLKEEIQIPGGALTPGTLEYVNSLTAELARENAAAIYDLKFSEDKAEAAERRAEARGGVAAIQ
ncbi:MAG: Panacea domain-containing protein [Chloroflexota bacterium]|nr:Panacea domain-containing protein [Chloroflexota bacterium]